MRGCRLGPRWRVAGSSMPSSSRSRRTAVTKKRATAYVVPFSTHYLKRRTTELATAKTRSLTDPLAAWAVKRIRLEGLPFRFDGHEYLRAIYDDTSPHVAVTKAAQAGGTTWASPSSLHACPTGLSAT